MLKSTVLSEAMSRTTGWKPKWKSTACFSNHRSRAKKACATKQVFQQKLETQLKEWDAKFDALKAKAQEARAEIRADVEKQIEALAGKRAAAQAKILELRQRTEDTWEDLKTGAEKIWEEMHEALDRIVSRFK